MSAHQPVTPERLLTELVQILYPEEDPEAQFTAEMADDVSQVVWCYEQSLTARYPHGSVTFAGTCSVCGAHQSLTVGHATDHCRISGTERKLPCYAQGSIRCNATLVLMERQDEIVLAKGAPVPSRCWHCHDHLEPGVSRCERCPEECDVEACSAPGCARSS